MTGIKYIRHWYNVPAKRGMTVRNGFTKQEGKIMSGKGGQYLSVRLDNGVCLKYHPLALDYLIDGVWILGEDYQISHDRKTNFLNWWNRQSDTAKQMMNER